MQEPMIVEQLLAIKEVEKRTNQSGTIGSINCRYIAAQEHRRIADHNAAEHIHIQPSQPGGRR